MNVKYYGLDSTLIHDAKPCDGFVIDVVRASDYATLLSELKLIELRLYTLVQENIALKAAAKKVIKMTRQHAKERHGDPMIAESWAYVKILRRAIKTSPVTNAFLEEVRKQGGDHE